MGDLIFGNVVHVVDGDTLDIEDVATSKFCTYPYRASERIRLANNDAPELGTAAGRRAHRALKARFENRRVRVDVVARETGGGRRLIGHVSVER